MVDLQVRQFFFGTQQGDDPQPSLVEHLEQFQSAFAGFKNVWAELDAQWQYMQRGPGEPGKFVLS